MTSPVQFDFGDGSPKVPGQGTGPWTAQHTYEDAGTHTVTVSKGDLSASTTVDVELPPDDGPAFPILTIQELSITAGDSDVEQSSSLRNSAGSSSNCIGRITITNGAPLDGKITEKMIGFWGAGKDLTVTWAVDGNDLVGTYGEPDGFPIVNPLDGQTTNRWTLAADTPAGDYSVNTAILDRDLPPQDTQRTSSSWTLRVSAAEPGRTVTSIVPSSSAEVGSTVTITGTGLTGVTQVQFNITGSDQNAAATVVDDSTVTAVLPPGTSGRTVNRVRVGETSSMNNMAELTGLNLVVSARPAPTLTSVTPDSGEVADRSELTLAGTNFATGLNALLYAEESSGGGTGVPTTVNSSTEATVSLRAADTPVIKRVSVTMPGGDESNVIDVDLTVTAATNGTSGATFTPTEGPVGTTVTVTGSGFSNVDNLTVKPPDGDRDFAVDHFNKQGDTTITFDIKNTFQTGPHTVSIYRSSVREDLADKFTVTA